MTNPGAVAPLNAQQLTIVQHVLRDRVTAVSAGAGSGKTKTLIAAAVELIGSRAATIDQFALVTFTVKAAEELRQRLQLELSSRAAESADPLWTAQLERLSAAFVGTIHGYCRDILRTHGSSTQIPRSSSVTLSGYLLHQALIDVLDRTLDAADAAAIPELADLGMADYELRQLVDRILGHCRSTGLDPRQVLAGTESQVEDAGRPYRRALARLLGEVDGAYTDLKAAKGVVDADDLLAATASILTSAGGDAVAQRVAYRHPILIVDEFQDTDRTQKRIVDALAPRLERLLVVGDLKQSIYGFRSADPSLLRLLAEEQGVGVLSLSISYRPTQVLLDTQNELFARLGKSYPELDDPLGAEEVQAEAAEPLRPIVYDRTDRDRSSTAITAYVRRLLGRTWPGTEHAIRPGDIVILTRSNRLADRMVEEVGALLSPDILVRRDTGESFYEHPEVVSTYLTIHAVLRPGDDAALSAALGGLYFTDVDPAQQELDQLQYRPSEGTPLTDWLAGEHPEHADRLARLRAAVRTDTAPQFLGRIFDTYGIIDRLRRQGDEAAAERLEHLREEAGRLFRSEEALTVRIFADYLRLRILQRYDVALPTGEADTAVPNHVRVMTIHRAKGLQFPIVIVPGLWTPLMSKGHEPKFFVSAEEGLDLNLDRVSFDTASSRWQPRLQEYREERLSEEFRLLYVAITRAQHSVILIGGSRDQPNPPTSRFYCWRDEVLPALECMSAEGHPVSLVEAGRMAGLLPAAAQG